MTISVSQTANNDEVFLSWQVDGNGTIPGCLGFAIERELSRDGHTTTAYLVNRVGFADGPAHANETQPSTAWPFQRYNWSDYDVTDGDRVRYRIVPVLKQGAGVQADEAGASEWTALLTLKSDLDGGVSPYFNRGISASNFVSRYMAAHKLPLSKLLDTISEHDSSLRTFMGGHVLEKLLALLAAAAKDKTCQVYASLFELRDNQLIDGLAKLGKRAHVVLADGSPKAADPDPNKDARARLKKAGCEVVSRMVAWNKQKKTKTGSLSHNKFLVFSRKGKPVEVWTGSTNWTPSGLCTQVNNGLLVTDAAVAGAYLSQWKRLAAAKSQLPPTLAASNAGGVRWGSGNASEIWFTATTKKGKIGRDIDELMAICANEAKYGILFLMFMPGSEPLGTIVARQQSDIYVRGVTNQYVSTATAAIELHTNKNPDSFEIDAPNPDGIKDEFAYWLKQVPRNQLGVLVHSKLIVIDPFTDKSVVIVGSHNFSVNASQKNDENFLIIRGNAPLAAAYAANIIGIYQHYRWNRYVTKTQKDGGSPWHKLSADPGWQNGYLSEATRQEQAFWAGHS